MNSSSIMTNIKRNNVPLHMIIIAPQKSSGQNDCAGDESEFHNKS